MDDYKKKGERQVDSLYSCFEELPSKIAVIFSRFNDRYNSEVERHKNELSTISKKYDSTVERINNDYGREKKLIEDRWIQKKQEIDDMRYDEEGKSLTKALNDAKVDFDNLRKLLRQMQQTYEIVSEKRDMCFKDNAGRFAEKRRQITSLADKSIDTFKSNESKGEQLCNDEIERINALIQLYKSNRTEVITSLRDSDLQRIKELRQRSTDDATKTYQLSLNSENDTHSENKDRLINDTRCRIDDLNPDEIRIKYEKILNQIPAYNSFEPATNMPESLGKGFLTFDLSQYMQSEEKGIFEYFCECFSFLMPEEKAGSFYRVPYGNSFQDKYFNQLITYDNASRDAALSYLTALEMRLFMTVPCGKLFVTMIDPVGVAKTFSMFSSLGLVDERVISKTIMCTEDRIEECLRHLIDHISHIQSTCLRDEYTDIIEYYEAFPKNAEPLQAIFIADYPRAFSDESCKMIEQLITSGPECGIYAFIAGNNEESGNAFAVFNGKDIGERIIKYSSGKIVLKLNGNECKVEPIILPRRSDITDVYEKLEEGIKNAERVVIDYEEISRGLIDNKERWFQFDCANGLTIPIGLESNRILEMHLGGAYTTRHHALITGTIGAGKSRVIHTIIMGILLKYSPKDVQIFYLDFKRGIESKIYAQLNLPNFKVISLDTEQEFGLAVLKYLDRLSENRAQGLKNSETSSIEGLNGKNYEAEHASRVVLIIDEFHMMLSGGDQSIENDCAKLLQTLLKQGRAMGIHVILATQTLPESELDYDQIMNRIVFQSKNAKDVLDSDNSAIDTIQQYEPGQGIFNDAGGGKDANRIARIALLGDLQRPEEYEKWKQLLYDIKERQVELYGDWVDEHKPMLLLSSIEDDNNPINNYVLRGEKPKYRDLGYQFYLGESIDLKGCSIRLLSRRGQNILIIGRDGDKAAQLYGFSALSILFNTMIRMDENRIIDVPFITFFDFQDEEEAYSDGIINKLCREFPSVFRIYGRESLVEGLYTIKAEIDSEKSCELRQFIIFAGLNRANRLLNSYEDNLYSETLKEIFEKIIRKGPEKGYSSVVWANEPGTFSTFFGEIVNEFDYRIMFDLTEGEYKQFALSGEKMSVSGHNALVYNVDGDPRKIRIYMMPTKEWMDSYIKRMHLELKDK